MTDRSDDAHLFTPTEDGLVPTGLARGPWNDDALHGGPVAAVLARALEGVEGSAAFFPARLSVELHRPVTFAPYRVRTRVARPGRRVRVLEADLVRRPDDVVVARAVLQQVERRALALPEGLADVNGPDRSPPPPEDLPRHTPPATGAHRYFHVDAVEHRTRSALLTEPGRALDWIRLRVGVAPGAPPTPFERVAAVADFGNGIAHVLPFDRFAFVNPDLSVHLFRLPVDEWVCLDAVTRIDPAPGGGSVGLAESALFDRRGRIGRALQSLLVTGPDA